MLITSTAYTQTTLPTFWDFSNPGISTPPNGWTLNQGTTGNLTYSGSQNSVGVDGVSCRLDSIGEYIQIWCADKPGQLSYWMRGTGISPNPAFTGTFTIQESINGSNWNSVRTFTTASPIPGTMTRFVDIVNSSSRYIRFFYTDKQSGSNVAIDSVVILQAPPSPNASINIKQGTTSLINGNTFVIGKNTSTLFTIENKGTAQALTIGTKTISGTNASDYTIPTMPTSIAPNSSDTFRIYFNPTGNGSKMASLSLVNGDTAKNPFVINLYGIGGSYATEPSVQPTNLSFTNLKAYGFKVSFKNASTKPEKYIVLRKKGSAITEIPADGQTYMRGDYIGSAQVAYIGTDTSFVPTYFFANTPYYFTVFAFNGPSGYENYLTGNPLSGNVTTTGSNIGSYYTGINATASTFITDLHNKINVHDTIFYGNYSNTIVNNFITRDTTGGKKVVNCVYTTLPYVYNDPFTWWTGTGGNPATLTREHTFAQSWMPSNGGGSSWYIVNGKELPEYNDQHHLFPADQINGNAPRSNYPFGEVVGTPTYISSTGLGKKGLDAKGNTVWEPRDEHKGDLARALFYMAVTYNGVNGKNWSLGAINGGKQNDTILKKWHLQDPPDAWEIARHEYINSIQHNRNPFIDNPSWVNYINFNNLTYISGVAPTPSITITAPNGGESWSSTATNTITWTSSNIDSAKIELWLNDTLFTVITPRTLASTGSYSWLSANNDLRSTKAKIKLTDTKSATSSVSGNYFTMTSTVGVNEVSLEKNISVYPNPSEGQVTIEFTSQQKTKVSFDVMDTRGRLIQTGTLTNNTASLHLPQGLYIIKLNSDGQTLVKKILVN